MLPVPRRNPGGMNARKILGAEHRPVRGRKAPWLTALQPGGPIYRALSDMVA
jgi:hypothetical protein